MGHLLNISYQVNILLQFLWKIGSNCVGFSLRWFEFSNWILCSEIHGCMYMMGIRVRVFWVSKKGVIEMSDFCFWVRPSTRVFGKNLNFNFRPESGWKSQLSGSSYLNGHLEFLLALLYFFSIIEAMKLHRDNYRIDSRKAIWRKLGGIFEFSTRTCSVCRFVGE